MKIKNLFIAFILAATSVLVVASHASASTIPTLTLSVQNTGSTQITVYGDPNSAVLLYYNNSTIGGTETETTGSLGSTNAYGYFSTTINNGTYNIPYNTLVYVTVDGQNSAQTTWPNYFGGTTIGPVTTGGVGIANGLSLSQTNINLQVAQTTAVTPLSGGNYTNGYNYPYGSYYGNYGTLVVQNNTNPTAVSTAIVGNQVNITGVNNGSAIITICESGINLCGTVYVTVGSQTTFPYPSYPSYPSYPTYPTYPSYPYPASSPVSFGTNGNNVSVNAGASKNITLYGSGNYYIYQNSNPAVVTATLNGNWLSVQGIQAGTSNITVCENNGTASCAQLFVDVIANQQSFYQQFSYMYPYSYPW